MLHLDGWLLSGRNRLSDTIKRAHGPCQSTRIAISLLIESLSVAHIDIALVIGRAFDKVLVREEGIPVVSFSRKRSVQSSGKTSGLEISLRYSIFSIIDIINSSSHSVEKIDAVLRLPLCGHTIIDGLCLHRRSYDFKCIVCRRGIHRAVEFLCTAVKSQRSRKHNSHRIKYLLHTYFHLRSQY